MARIFLFALLCLSFSSASSGVIDFFTGFANGYGYSLTSTCCTSITGINTAWNTYESAKPTSKGSGSALYKYNDFTQAIAQALSNCNMLQIANLLDQAFSTNLASTLVRFISQMRPIVTDWVKFTTNLKIANYIVAGQALGAIVQDLVG